MFHRFVNRREKIISEDSLPALGYYYGNPSTVEFDYLEPC